MIKFAGLAFNSTQDMAYGDMLTNSGYGGNHIGAVLFTLFSLALLLPPLVLQHRAILGEFTKHLQITLLCALAFASAVWSQNPLVTLHAAGWLMVSVAFVYWLNIRFSDEQVMQLMIAIGVALALLCTVTAIAFPRIGLDRLHENAWQGVCTSKNHMGRIFVFLLTPALHCKERNKWRFAYIFLILILIGLSQSRSAWLATILYLLLAATLWSVGGLSRRSIALILTCAIPMLATAAWMIFSKSESLFRLFGRDTTLSGRTTIWKVLLLSVSKRPLFGFGYQAFWAGTQSEAMNAFMGVYGAMRFMASYAHSGYLAIALETGIIGMAMVAWLIMKAAKDAAICFRRNRTGLVNWYIGLVFLTVIYNIDEVTFMLPAYLPWMMFLHAVIGLSDEADRVRGQRDS